MRTFLILILVIALCAAALYAFTRKKEFGRPPEGERKARIERSPHYKNGRFENLTPTPQMSGEKSRFKVFYEFIFKKPERAVPSKTIPHQKTDISSINEEEDFALWLGHSSIFIRLNGKNFLIDPVFSDYAAPISFFNKAFPGSNPYSSKDMPPIDYLIFTHDHYDHLDYPTVEALKEKVGKIICPLGIGAHLEYWGFLPENIIETDWNEETLVDENITVHTLPARHFSGRLRANQTLWASFLLETKDLKIYLSGDGGYGPHFDEIGRRFGRIDAAFLENGQYNEDWRYIHMSPEETANAAKSLNVKKAVPIHNSKFVLSKHAWDEPMKELALIAEKENINLLTPEIGQKIELKNKNQKFEKWWESLN